MAFYTNILSGFSSIRFVRDYNDDFEENDDLDKLGKEIRSVDQDIDLVEERLYSCRTSSALIKKDYENQEKYYKYKVVTFVFWFILAFIAGMLIKYIYSFWTSFKDLLSINSKYDKDLEKDDIRILLSLGTVIGVILTFATIFAEKFIPNLHPVILMISFVSFILMLLGIIFGIKFLKTKDKEDANKCWFFTILGITCFVVYIGALFIMAGLFEFIKTIFSKLPEKP